MKFRKMRAIQIRKESIVGIIWLGLRSLSSRIESGRRIWHGVHGDFGIHVAVGGAIGVELVPGEDHRVVSR